MPLSRRARILVRWVAVLAGIGFGRLAILLVHGTALVDRAFTAPSQRTTYPVLSAPLEIARAYAVFLARGQRPGVRLERGTTSAPERVFHPSVAANVRAILEDVPHRGTAAVLAGVVSGPLAAKTGTTDERRDSWFVAMRPRMVTVVWVGTDGNRETGLYGATGALAVWRRIDGRVPPVWRGGDF
jgi:cell division protein FtsI/penicillin-binding protein 2